MDSKERIKERMNAHEYEKTIQKLLEKIDILENKLKSAGIDRIKIVTGFKQLEQENNFLKTENEKMEKEKEDATKNSNDASTQLEIMKNQHESVISNYKTKFQILSRDIQDKEEQIDKLLEQIKEKDNKIKYMTVNNAINMRYSDSFQTDVEKYKLINKSQKERIDELEKEINDLYINKKSEGNLIMENQHLKDDNLRLLEMLKTTNEYKDFAYLNETTPGGIRFVHDPPLSKKHKHECEKRETENLLKKNNENWIPNEAFNIIYDFKKKYNMEINDKVISDLLGCLNQVWRDKERKQITRVKAKYQREIIDLKKKYGIQVYNGNDFEEEKKQIEKTKCRAQRIDKRDIINNQFNGMSKQLVENAKEVANKFDGKRKGYEDQIKVLKGQLIAKDIKKNKKSVNQVSINLIDRALGEIDKIILTFNELQKEFHDRIKDTEIMASGNLGNANIKMVNNNVKWLLKSMNDILENSKSRLNSWKNEFSGVNNL